jgi:hypothetical protein
MEFACFTPESFGQNVGGRPTKFTPDLLEKLAEAIALGCPDRIACDRVDIDEETLHDWRHHKPGFSEYLNRARSERMIIRIKRIDSGEAGWQGSAWMLERRWGTHFARPELQISMSVNAVVEHTVNMIPEAELHRLINLAHGVDIEVSPIADTATPALTDAPVEDDASQGV